MTEHEKLEYLMQSETVQLVMYGNYTPKDLDNAIRNMKKRIRELEHIRQLDMAQIVALRRQIELLAWGDKDAATH